MRLSMNLTTLRTWPLSASQPLKKLGLTAVALAACVTPIAHADATLTYELTGTDGSKTVKKFSTTRFHIRIEDPAAADQYLLFEAGKFFPLYAVDTTAKTYTRLTEEVIPFMSPQSRQHHGADKAGQNASSAQTAESTTKPTPKFKPTRKTRKVAGVECRVVHELVDDKPVIEHCMANSARLGVTKREIINMARTFEMARNRDYGWLGVGTEDEEFVSVYSLDQRDNRVSQLTEVSTTPLVAGYLRIPRDYKQTKAEEQAATDKSKAPEER
jgi:hypothetical protein